MGRGASYSQQKVGECTPGRLCSVVNTYPVRPGRVDGSVCKSMSCLGGSNSCAVVLDQYADPFSVFSGCILSETPDPVVVSGIPLLVNTEIDGKLDNSSSVVDTAHLLGVSPEFRVSDVTVQDGGVVESPMGAAILNLVEREAHSCDVIPQDGGEVYKVERVADSDSGFGDFTCELHGTDSCYSCEHLELDVISSDNCSVDDNYPAGHDYSTIPLYRLGLSEPKIVDSVELKSGWVYRPCGLYCKKYHGLSGVPLQLNPCVFFTECYSHPAGVDPKADYIFDGVLNGFRIVDKEYDGTYFRDNYNSIVGVKAKAKMDKLVSQELSCGKVIKVPNRPQCVHSLGAIHKPDGSIRPITDCSRGQSGPEGKSINEFMDSTCEKFSFVKMDHIVDAIKPRTWFSVIDIQSAYRSISIRPADREKQGFSWNMNGSEDYYLDCSLSFGLKCAPYIFTQITEFVIRCLGRRGVYGIFGYLDDYLVMGDSQEECRSKQTVLIELLRQLGFHIAWKKIMGPSQVTRYLGLELDSINMEIRLPSDKVERTRSLIKEFRNKKVCSRKDLQVLSGYLAHASQVVKGGRTFSRRIINLIKYIPDDGKVVHIPSWLGEDLKWWVSFIDIFNGKAKMVQPSVDGSPQVETDSSKSGFGARWDGDWLAGVWDQEREQESITYLDHHWSKSPEEVVEDDDINILELWPVLASLDRWGEVWRDRKVVIWTDNTQVQSMILTGRSKSIKAMWWLRELFWRSCLYNIHIVSRRISTKQNLVADYLSRLFDSRSKGTLPPSLKDWLCCFQETG